MTEPEEQTVLTQETPAPPKVEEADWKDKYFRTLAEMENMRKRMQKERQEMARFGIENAITEFLPAIDNFENALRLADNAGDDVKNWAIGFKMILSQCKEVLHNHGIVSFHSEGNTFNAQLHEAVEMIETTAYPDGMILQEFTKGYKSASRTVRPARVKVAKHPQNTEISACAEPAEEERK